MQTARLWFARIVMTYALLIFAFLSYLYVIEPLDHIAGFGISASGVPESINFLRAGPGALFLGMTLFAAYGLVRPGHLRNCLLVLVIFNAGDGSADPAAHLDYRHQNTLVVTLQGKLESEIAQLDDPDDVAMFLAEYHIEKPSRERVLQLSYDLLGIQSFFTYGEVFIVPAKVGAYTIRPCGAGKGQKCATIKGYIRF